MGAGGSVAQELTSPRKIGHVANHRQGGIVPTPATSQYREMLDHLRSRFTDEIEVLREKHGEVDQDALIVKLLISEISFTTVEADDLPALKLRQRDKGKVYLLGETHFMQEIAPACVNVAGLKPKALDMVGDEELYTVAREALPANTRTSKKAVELMGSTKVVTEKKALKRLGSEMTEDMRALQMKSERKQQKEEMSNRRTLVSSSTLDVSRDGAGAGAGAGAAAGAGAGAGAAAGAAAGPGGNGGGVRASDGDGVGGDDAGGGGGGGGGTLTAKKSMQNMRLGSPGSFIASTPMARRATRLLTEVPKFISDIGGGGGSKADVLTK